MLFRKAKNDILKWLRKGNDAILITGARQVGKSFLIEKTLEEQNVDYVEFNFIRQSKYLDIFKSAIEDDADRFLMEIEVAAGRKLSREKGKTIWQEQYHL